MKNPTLFSDLVAAHLERREKPTFEQVIDHVFNAVRTTPEMAWSGAKGAQHIHGREVALNIAKSLVNSDPAPQRVPGLM